MTEGKFCILKERLWPYLLPGKTPNYQFLPVEKKEAVTLYYLKDTGPLWITANTFEIYQCSVYENLHEVCSAVSKHLGPEDLHLPSTKEEIQSKVVEFETKFGMLQAFVCNLPIQLFTLLKIIMAVLQVTQLHLPLAWSPSAFKRINIAR